MLQVCVVTGVSCFSLFINLSEFDFPFVAQSVCEACSCMCFGPGWRRDTSRVVENTVHVHVTGKFGFWSLVTT